MMYKISGSITLMLARLVLGAWKFHTTVCMERTFNAYVAEVLRVWNDADSIKKWWGPNSYTALVVRNDVQAGEVLGPKSRGVYGDVVFHFLRMTRKPRFSSSFFTSIAASALL